VICITLRPIHVWRS